MDRLTDKSKLNKSESVDDEVHQKLFHWFEKRGLLLELRAHMRQQMVRALQENVSGFNGCRKRLSSSPKFQAMHMLIADFLLQQEHHYTVSVFSTEVPILNSLPEFSTYVADILKASKEGTLPITTSAPRFTTTDIQDILETLGLPPHTQVGVYAANLYEESGEALLTCVVRALSSLYGGGTSHHNLPSVNNQLSISFNTPRNQPTDSDEEACDSSEQDAEHWTTEMREILLQSDVKIRHINKLQEKMRKFHENELLRVRQEEASKYETLCTQQVVQMKHKLREEISREYSEQEQELEKQKEDLHSLALQLHVEHAEVTERLSELQIQSDEVEDKKKQQENESTIMERIKDEIDLKQREIEASFTRLTIDQENLRREQDILKSYQIESNNGGTNQEEFQKIVQQQYPVLSKQLEETKDTTNHDNILVLCQPKSTTSTQTQMQDLIDRDQQTSCSSQPDPELLHQLQLERETISQLQEDNTELRAYVLQQRCRIDELTHRATTLAVQLEESQRSIAEHECQERVVAIPPPPILPPISHPPLINPTHSYLNWQPQRNGAGEESFFTPRHNVAQQPSVRHEPRRRPLRFNCSQHNSTASEDSSPTDEILREARRRLQDLEEQSAAVDRSYRQFQARQLEEPNTVILNRNTPNSHANHITNYFSSTTVPSQIPFRRPLVVNHPRLHRQTHISDDSDDDESNLIHSRRPLFSRHKNITSRFFIPPDNPLPPRRLYFTNFKHFSKYASFKKRHGKSPIAKTTNENRALQNNNSDWGHSSNQGEQSERNSTRTENQACQTNFKLYNTNKETNSDSDSSSDSDSFFNSNQKIRYKSSEIVQLKDYKKSKLTTTVGSQFELNVKNIGDRPEQSKPSDVKDTNEKLDSPKQIIESQFVTIFPKIIMNPLSSAISSGSLAVESIPKDDSTKEREDSTNLPQRNVDQLDDCNNTMEPNVNEFINNCQTEEVNIVEYEHIVPEPLEEPLLLTVPNVKLLNEEAICETQTSMLRGLEHQGEENVEIPVSAIALSITSGSDIFRELEISHSEQSDDISAPDEHFSKNSSDFWE